MSTAVEFEGIGKSFGGLPVLRQVSFAVPAGRTLGLVGENGAGKSTLMNILGGNLRPDTGRLWLDGRPFAPATPAAAVRAGVGFTHQELNLFPNLSIAENLFLTDFPRWPALPLIRRRALRERAARLLATVGLELPPDTPVERLSPGERQLVEIAKALGLEARVIILDEPTSSLSARESERIFAVMDRLREHAITMIYISHALSDVLRLCDELVVLRDGAVVSAGPRADYTLDKLVTQMVGRSLSQWYPTRVGRPAEQVSLEVRSLSHPGVVRDVSFQLRRGEVLGLAGLLGAGRSELARILFGLEPCARGGVWLDGQPLRGGPRHRIARGLAFLTDDRRTEGLCLEASLADNIALVSLRERVRSPLRLVRAADHFAAVTAMREAVRITPSARAQQPVKTLSGGNQQKVVLAKWLLARPRVLILDEPTRGIDVGAKQEIYQLIVELADRGSSVLLISSELEELTGLCDRILVMSGGEIRDCLGREEFDRERVLRAALKQPVRRGKE